MKSMKKILSILLLAVIALSAKAQTQFRDLSFEEALATAAKEKKQVFIDFYTDWCGPCKMLAPVLEELEPEYPEIRFVRVNVDEEDELAAEYRIMSIPFVALFKDGEKVATMVGYHGKADVEEFLSQVK